MAILDCSQIYFAPEADVHTSPTISPKAVPQPVDPALQPPSYSLQRTSLNHSEPTSTTSGSENERVFSSGDEDSMEFQSDTAYDSMATRATMSSNSDLPGLEIERLFDASSAPEATKPSLIPSDELVLRSHFRGSSQHDGTLLDGLHSLSTPRDRHPHHAEAIGLFDTPISAQGSRTQLNSIASSPPAVPYPEFLQCERRQAELIPAERKGIALLDSELWDEGPYTDSPQRRPVSPDLPQHTSPIINPSLPRVYQNSPPPHQQSIVDICEGKRLSIFDWSEQQRSDRDSLYGSSPRPRTVHSKQSNDGRGGRAPGRRGPNALHLRSQSVPATKESYLDSDPAYPPAKFGTWGLGNKGVSEEWTDDFEFDEAADDDAQQSSEKP